MINREQLELARQKMNDTISIAMGLRSSVNNVRDQMRELEDNPEYFMFSDIGKVIDAQQMVIDALTKQYVAQMDAILDATERTLNSQE